MQYQLKRDFKMTDKEQEFCEPTNQQARSGEDGDDGGGRDDDVGGSEPPR